MKILKEPETLQLDMAVLWGMVAMILFVPFFAQQQSLSILLPVVWCILASGRLRSGFVSVLLNEEADSYPLLYRRGSSIMHTLQCQW